MGHPTLRVRLKQPERGCKWLKCWSRENNPNLDIYLFWIILENNNLIDKRDMLPIQVSFSRNYPIGQLGHSPMLGWPLLSTIQRSMWSQRVPKKAKGRMKGKSLYKYCLSHPRSLGQFEIRLSTQELQHDGNLLRKLRSENTCVFNIIF